MGSVPVQAPVSARTIEPTCGLPSTVSFGLPAVAGGVASTGPTGAERTVAALVAFVAVTRRRRRRPMSAPAITYLAAVASGTGTQPSPARSQRSHCSAKAIGLAPVQSPAVAVTALPGRTLAAVSAGGRVCAGGGASTTLDGADTAVATPIPLSTVTATRRVEPTSSVRGL